MNCYRHFTIAERACLRKYYVEGKSYREFARLLAVTLYRKVATSIPLCNKSTVLEKLFIINLVTHIMKVLISKKNAENLSLDSRHFYNLLYRIYKIYFDKS